MAMKEHMTTYTGHAVTMSLPCIAWHMYEARIHCDVRQGKCLGTLTRHVIR